MEMTNTYIQPRKSKILTKRKFKKSHVELELPRKHVMQNIMNYSAVLSIKNSSFIGKLEYLIN